MITKRRRINSSFIGRYFYLAPGYLSSLVSRRFPDGMQIANYFARLHWLNDRHHSEIMHSACVRGHAIRICSLITRLTKIPTLQSGMNPRRNARGSADFRMAKRERSFFHQAFRDYRDLCYLGVLQLENREIVQPAGEICVLVFRGTLEFRD